MQPASAAEILSPLGKTPQLRETLLAGFWGEPARKYSTSQR